jgi:hypothetical protein
MWEFFFQNELFSYEEIFVLEFSHILVVEFDLNFQAKANLYRWLLSLLILKNLHQALDPSN